MQRDVLGVWRAKCFNVRHYQKCPGLLWKFAARLMFKRISLQKSPDGAELPEGQEMWSSNNLLYKEL